MHKVLVLAAAAALCVGMAACGGGDTPQTLAAGAGSGGSSGGSGGTGGTGGTGGGTTTPTYSMGNGSGSSFQSGIIGITGLPTGSQLSAGGTASLVVSVVDQNGALYTGNTVNIDFNSTCIGQGLATITPSGTTTAGTNPGEVSTTSGIANVTYTAKGCATTDVITATSTVAGTNLSATGSIAVASATAGSIQFVSATPATIGLKGTGLGETSTVIFKVVDSTGGPVPNAQVTFTLSTPVGGLGLAPSSGSTASDGTVRTVVSSGTQHTAIRVIATMTSPALTTQSSLLSVTTGLPTSRAFSTAVTCQNQQAYDHDGVTVPVTVHLADRFGNPAPDGTTVAFTTNGGTIGGNCSTPSSAQSPGDGACSVNWVSANPRPLTTDPVPVTHNGRATILATAIGEESFTDANGNGYYDSGEAFQDLGEPFRDDNESGTYNAGEYFLDFNHDSQRNAPSGVFKGITCNGSDPTSTCSTSTLAIGASNLIIMSSDTAKLVITNITGFTFGGTLQAPGTLTLTHGTSGTISYTLWDIHDNPMANSTTVATTADPTIGAVGQLPSPYKVPCTIQGGQPLASTLTAPATLTGSPSGNLIITVTSHGDGLANVIAFPVVIN